MTPYNFQSNRLGEASSPYLRQHADNPVHWQEWSPKVLAHARELQKPILLSIGYAACHWCHVMAHESFEDANTANLMNELFINIKVDREERPDVDQLYMAALHATGQQGGWPLTMFLTPDAIPYWGGTYFPPEPKHGLPSFSQVLEHLANAYHSGATEIARNGQALQDHLVKLNQPPMPDDEPFPELVTDFAKRTLDIYDEHNGGLKGTQKFPNAPILECWARQAGTKADSQAGKAFLHTMEQMCRGGIYDHLAGGIARYTVDEKWLVPHFEKMLYDNAHFLHHLNCAFKLSGNQMFRNRIKQTVKWVSTEMLSPEGAFYSSLDADSEDIEGKFYVWSNHEIQTLLGEEHDAFSSSYNVSSEGNWEGVNILNRLDQSDDSYETESMLEPARDKLLAARNKRIRPGTDDKVLTDWNGYMIRALAEAATLFDRQDWLEAAVTAFHFICESSQNTPWLNHSWREGVSVFPANTTDYAAMINAGLSLYEITQKKKYLEAVSQWLDILDREHADGKGGFFLTSERINDLITRPRCDQDEANPAGASQLLEALVRHSHLADETSSLQKAEALAKNLYAISKSSPYGMAGFMNGLDTLFHHVHISISEFDTETGKELYRAVQDFPIVSRTITEGSNVPLYENTFSEKPGKASAIVCQHKTCSLPADSTNALEGLLFQTVNRP